MWRKQPLRKPFKEYIDMKVKLKKGEIVPRDNSFSGLSKQDYNDLNAGKSVEMDSVPKLIESLVEKKEKSIKEK
jgi:hypothetical protein